VELFEDSHWAKEQLRNIILVSARRDQPTVHSCVELGLEEVACRYLRKRPHALFDTKILHMTALHTSVLKRSRNVVQEIGSIAQNVPEFDRGNLSIGMTTFRTFHSTMLSQTRLQLL
jgi:hypothetical protein